MKYETDYMMDVDKINLIKGEAKSSLAKAVKVALLEGRFKAQLLNDGMTTYVTIDERFAQSKGYSKICLIVADNTINSVDYGIVNFSFKCGGDFKEEFEF